MGWHTYLDSTGQGYDVAKAVAGKKQEFSVHVLRLRHFRHIVPVIVAVAASTCSKPDD